MIDIISFVKEYSYVGIFLVIFLESGIFFLLPGDSLLFTIGILASKDFISFPIALIVLIIATILGGQLGYIIGRYFEHIFENKHIRKIFPKHRIEQVREYFQKKGQSTILICRFVPVVRTFAPIVAGFSEMKFSIFWKYNVIGGILWGAVITTAGYTLGNSFPTLEHNIGKISLLIVFVSLLPFVWKYVKKTLTLSKLSR